MINIKHIKLNKKRKLSLKTYSIIGASLFALTGMFLAFKGISNWYDTHEIKFNPVVQIKFNKPVEIVQRQVQVTQIVNVMNEIPNPVDLDTDAEKYIYEVFGIENYKIAIAVARAESGLREDAININTNNTIDVGVFQINSIHFKKTGCSLKEVSTIKGNVDCAYQIYTSSGWTPWVAWKTGAFVNKYD